MSAFNIKSFFVACQCFICFVAFAAESGQDVASRATAESRIATYNHLVGEHSPYLLQHASDPVNWYPWGDEAFEKARSENKPILLSIGYSACHWCHVMARESFENPEIAELINRYFVAVIVDREERPDIDNVYLAATELINGVGGWPMTLFLNHQLQPFHAATYIPPETRGEFRGLKDLLPEIHQLWSEQRERVDKAAGLVTERIRADAKQVSAAEQLHENIHAQSLALISADYDQENGGFGEAPKFPRPGIYLYLPALAQHDDEMAGAAGAIMKKTLTHMAQGGLYDQLGGGFYRYSVDAGWQQPHFEKMLYSQALAVMAYTRMYQLDPQPLYEHVVRGTLEFVLREMTSPEAGFYSALDADSARPENPNEHAEGAYYLWSADELENILGEKDYESFAEYYSVRPQGNIASDPQAEFGVRNILRVNADIVDKSFDQRAHKRLEQTRRKLLGVRALRPRPSLDDKVITAWNGMMVGAFVEAYRVFGEKRWLQAGQDALDHLLSNLFEQKTGRLLRRARGADAGIDAALEDYAWLIHALLDVYETSHDKVLLVQAQKLQALQDSRLRDENHGAYYDSGTGDESLLFRSMSAYDTALPSGNAISVRNLGRLALLTGDGTYLARANKTLAAFAGAVNRDPAATAMMLEAELFIHAGAQGIRHTDKMH